MRDIIDMQRQITGQTVTVVPVLISKGRVSREKFTADLHGLDIRYEGTPLLPHALLAQWIERRVTEAMRSAVAEAQSSPRPSRRRGPVGALAPSARAAGP